MKGNVRAVNIPAFTWMNSGRPRNNISLASLWTDVLYRDLPIRNQCATHPVATLEPCTSCLCMSGCCNAVRNICCLSAPIALCLPSLTHIQTPVSFIHSFELWCRLSVSKCILTTSYSSQHPYNVSLRILFCCTIRYNSSLSVQNNAPGN
jgi:hypothetical protein